ncbi:MAG TPA: putative baseplate assembly protein [Solirubrobacteraceae bacterium]|nr:putative baseplate assembly protein [Solirubrobacteraceae bacterium]
MSRPPRPHPAASTGAEQSGDLARLDYLPLEYADLLALQDELAVARLGRPRTQASGEADEPDVARTFMELSALVGHVLAVYQRHYAGEAYISTARAPSSLVRHARRLAYDPDPGLAASGHAVLFAKPGAGGTVAAGLALASTPLGEQEAQDYETHADVAVDAALNELEPRRAQRPVTIAAGARELRLQGTGHAIAPGDEVALVAAALWKGFVVEAVDEDVDADVTTVGLDDDVGAQIEVGASAPPVLLARAARKLRQFGAGADPALFPPSALRGATGAEGTGAPKYKYIVERAEGPSGYVPEDVYLAEQLDEPLVGRHVLRTTGAGRTVLRVTAEVAAAVALERTAQESVELPTVTLAPTDGGFTSTVTTESESLTVTQRIAANVTAIRVAARTGGPIARASLPLPARWLAGWATEALLAAGEPNPSPLEQPLELPGRLAALTPGRPLVFTNRSETVAQVVTIRRAQVEELDAAAQDDGVGAVTKVWWDPFGDAPAGAFELGDLKVFGNAARVSHGRTVREALGGSDGVTPFQRFALRQSPLTVLPGAAGGEPALEVRVDDVLWQRVEDFARSGPVDRHYRSQTDEDAVTTIVFGDGRNGAVPPSGDENVRAIYRVGLGRAGDVEPRRLSRLKRAHPLLARAVNVTPISGGAEPADAAAIRSQSTRWIRTFDRAVSVSDVADLALMMPGVARAAARWDQARGIVLVVATAAGDAPAAPDAVRAFLDARRDVTVPLQVRGPQPRDVRIVVDVEPDPAHLVEVVKSSVREALHGEAPGAPGMFTFAARGLGQPAYLSELYARLEAVPGVVGARVARFAAEAAGGVADVIAADVEQWLRLAPNDLELTIGGSAR